MGTRLEVAAGVRGDVRSLAFSVIATLVAVIDANQVRNYRALPGRIWIPPWISWHHRLRDLRVGGSGKFAEFRANRRRSHEGGCSSRTSEFRPFRRLNRSKVARGWTRDRR